MLTVDKQTKIKCILSHFKDKEVKYCYNSDFNRDKGDIV